MPNDRNDQVKMDKIGRALRHSQLLRDPARLLDVLERSGIRVIPLVGGVRVVARDDGFDRTLIFNVLDEWFNDRRNLLRVIALLRFADEPSANVEAA